MLRWLEMVASARPTRDSRRSAPPDCSVGDVLVPKVVLEGPRVMTLARELVAAGMSQHVRMHLGTAVSRPDQCV
jgi:hypothetical protein